MGIGNTSKTYHLKTPSMYHVSIHCSFEMKLMEAEALETVLDDSLIRFLNRRELDFR